MMAIVEADPAVAAAFGGDVEALARAIELTVRTPAPLTAIEDLPRAMPVRGIGAQAALAQFAAIALPDAGMLRDPLSASRMAAPTPWVTWAAASWVASRSENLLDQHTNPQAEDLHDLLMAWLTPLYGMNAGHLVPGTTVANLTALWTARDSRGAIRIAASESAHDSMSKVARVLGMPLVTLPADENDVLDVGGLADMARRDPEGLTRTAIVLTAGTHTTGAIDPLIKARKAIKRLGLQPAWWHIDASWAGPLILTERYRDLLKGIADADSVAVAPHKLMFQPTELAFVMFKDAQRSKLVLEFSGPGEMSQIGLLGSRKDRALGLALTFLAYGQQGVAHWIEESIAAIVRVSEGLRLRDDVDVFATPSTGVLLWAPTGKDASDVAETLGLSTATTTFHEGRRWIRHVGANPLLDSDGLLAAIDAALQ